MGIGFPELSELRVEVPDETREAQWTAIAQALEDVPARSQVPRRRRVAVWVAAAFSIGLPAAAVAAEGTVPGDFLYPVKLVVEPVRSLFDPDVAAVHRVEELERLFESDALVSDIDRALNQAERAVDDAKSPELTQRVERVRDQVRDRRESDQAGTDRVSEPVPTEDGPTATVTDQPRDTDTRSTTTTTQNDGHSDDPQRGSDGSGPTTTGPRQGSTSTDGDQAGDERTSDGG